MADPGVDKDKVYLVCVDAGKPASVLSMALPSDLKEGQKIEVRHGELKIGRMTLPEGLKPEEVKLSAEYSDAADEDMRTVREVNEDPPDVLRVTIRKQVPAYIDRITVNFEMGSK